MRLNITTLATLMNWMLACDRALKTPLEALLSTLQVLGYVVVVFYFCSFALASVFFWRWKILKLDGRALVWRYYGLFTGMISIGSLCGGIAWGSKMGQRMLQ
jgi:hypothetical protein